MGIVGLILLLSFPTLANFREQVYLESASNQLVSDLRLAQAKAICFNETQACDRFKFAKTGNPPPGGSGTALLSGRSGSVRKVIVSSAGRVRVE
jgi:Tfp pilus assembly protein FimT